MEEQIVLVDFDPCVVCSSSNIHPSSDGVLTRCMSCGFTRVTSYVSDDSKYSVGHYKTIRTSFYSLIAYFIDALIIFLFHIKKQYKILDFGCGKGIHLKLFSKFHRSLTGLEIEDNRRNFAQSLLSDTELSIVKSLDEIGNQSFDFVYSLHVFEHIEDLDEVINGLKAYVSSGSILLIEVPNFGGFASRTAGRNWSHFTPEYHVNHFDQNSFKKLFARHGFELKGMKTFSFYHGAMSQISVLLNFFGLNGGNLYRDAKSMKWSVVCLIGILFPFAVVLEIVSSLFGQGSVLRATFVQP